MIAATPEQLERLQAFLANRPPEQPVPRGVLYRHYDREGVLLYVGITDELRDHSRHLAHSHEARWWTFVARVDREMLADRAAVAAVESQVIREERPIFNRLGSDAEQLQREKAYLGAIALQHRAG